MNSFKEARMELKQLCRYLDELLPSQGMNDSCPNGLQVEGKSEVRRIATAVSASVATIEAALELESDVLIVHHGLFWQRESPIIQGVKRQKLALLLNNGMSLFAYHLPLDRHPQLGNNWRAAQEMGWKDLQPFGYLNGIPIGVKGQFEACTQEAFKKQLESYYQHSAVEVLGGPQILTTAALISGGAHYSIMEASQEGVDAFITGNFDEPTWHQALENKINFFALGHSATERVGPRALSEFLARELTISCSFIDILNPF